MVMQSHSHSLFDGIYHHHHLKTTLPALCQIHLRHELFKKPKGKKTKQNPKRSKEKRWQSRNPFSRKLTKHARTHAQIEILNHWKPCLFEICHNFHFFSHLLLSLQTQTIKHTHRIQRCASISFWFWLLKFNHTTAGIAKVNEKLGRSRSFVVSAHKIQCHFYVTTVLFRKIVCLEFKIGSKTCRRKIN